VPDWTEDPASSTICLIPPLPFKKTERELVKVTPGVDGALMLLSTSTVLSLKKEYAPKPYPSKLVTLSLTTKAE